MSAVVEKVTAEKAKFDPIMLEVIRSLLIAIMDECEINLSRTAFSPIIYEVKDYCIGLLDKDCRTIAQSRGSVPTFMSDLGDSVRDGIEIYGETGFEPGDVLLMNFSDVCGQHLNNVVVYLPVFLHEKLIGFMASRAHWSDVGGKSPGSWATDTTEIFQEGLHVPPVKFMNNFKIVPEVEAILRCNSRTPDLILGDLHGQVGTNRIGEKRVQALLDKYGEDLFLAVLQELFERTERRVRRNVSLAR